MRIATFATSVWLTLLGPMVLAQSVTYDYDRAANFANYKTYAWTRGTELSDPLNHARAVRAIDAALVAKGLARVEPGANPDVVVAYHASFEKNLEITGSTHGLGPLGLAGDRFGSARVQPILVGTLVVDLSDARTRAIVWRSVASSDIRPTDKPESRDKKIAKATAKMFKNYPPKPYNDPATPRAASRAHISEPEIELRAREAQARGGPRPVPAALAQDLGDGLALDRAEIGGHRARRSARRVQCEVLHTDESAFAQDGRALERVAELADVARPVVPERRLPGVPREARRRPRERLADILQRRLADDLGRAWSASR